MHAVCFFFFFMYLKFYRHPRNDRPVIIMRIERMRGTCVRHKKKTTDPRTPFFSSHSHSLALSRPHSLSSYTSGNHLFPWEWTNIVIIFFFFSPILFRSPGPTEDGYYGARQHKTTPSNRQFPFGPTSVFIFSFARRFYYAKIVSVGAKISKPPRCPGLPKRPHPPPVPLSTLIIRKKLFFFLINNSRLSISRRTKYTSKEDHHGDDVAHQFTNF